MLYCQNTWQLAKDRKGIKVYVKKVKGSDFYAFKAVMSVKAAKEEIIKILKDVNNYPEWHAFTASAKLIEQSKYEQLFVMETDFPWPYANECMIYTMIFPKNESNYMEITLVGTRAKTECKYSFEYASGYILLESENNNTQITYYFHSNPSQKIPAWLTNPQIHDLPYQTFVSLRNRLEKTE
jgi:hypothetical protein